MKYLTLNKQWEIDRDYNCDKLLYLLIDRPDEINETSLIPDAFEWNDKLQQNHRDYNLPAGHYEGQLFWAIVNYVTKTLST